MRAEPMDEEDVYTGRKTSSETHKCRGYEVLSPSSGGMCPLEDFIDPTTKVRYTCNLKSDGALMQPSTLVYQCAFVFISLLHLFGDSDSSPVPSPSKPKNLTADAIIIT